MQIKQKRNLKRIVDVCLTALLLCLMAYPVTGEKLHEWFGIGMTVLLIFHHVLNARWYASLFKGRYNAYRVVTTAVNTLLLVSFACTALCGMAMSAHAVPLLYGILPVSFARQVHLALSYWSFLLMGLHLGLHIPVMTAGLKRSRKACTAADAAAAVVSGIGFLFFVQNGIPQYIFFRNPFAFFDYAKPAVVVFAENLAILFAFAFLGERCAGLLKYRKNKSGRGRKEMLFCAVPLLAAVLIGTALLLLKRIF